MSWIPSCNCNDLRTVSVMGYPTTPSTRRTTSNGPLSLVLNKRNYGGTVGGVVGSAWLWGAVCVGVWLGGRAGGVEVGGGW